MRRVLSLLLALLLVGTMALTLTSCGKGECDLCGQTESLNTFKTDGEKLRLCDDCYKLAKIFAS